MVRSTASIALHVLRLLEDALIKDASHNLIVRTRTEVALYILNQKRAKLTELEARFGVSLTVGADATLTGMVYHAIERGEPATPLLPIAPRQDLVRVDSIAPTYDDGGADLIGEDAEDQDGGDEAEGEEDIEGTGERGFSSGDGTGEGGRKRKRRRRRRGRDRDASAEISADAPQPPDDGLATMAHIEGDFPVAGIPAEDESASDDVEASPDEPASAEDLTSSDGTSGSDEVVGSDDVAGNEPVPPVVASVALDDTASETIAEEAQAAEPPRRRRSRRNAQRVNEAVTPPEASSAEGAETEVEAPAEDEAAPPPKRRRQSRARAAAAPVAPLAEPVADETPDLFPQPSDTTAAVPATEEPSQPAISAEHAAEPDLPAETAPVAVHPESEPAVSAPEVETEAKQEPVAPPAPPQPEMPKRSGWWQRAKATFGS